MKKKLILVSLLIAILFAIVGCCKDGECKKDKKDYREKWVGTYECEENYSWWRLTGIHTWTSTSGNEIFQTIVVVTALDDSLLNFLGNRKGSSYEAKVDKNGFFFENFGLGGGMCGNFIVDSLYMEIANGTQGSKYVSTYKGKKIK